MAAYSIDLRQKILHAYERRQVEIVKMRAMLVHGGRHDCVMETGGLRVFPRLMPASPTNRVTILLTPVRM